MFMEPDPIKNKKSTEYQELLAFIHKAITIFERRQYENEKQKDKIYRRNPWRFRRIKNFYPTRRYHGRIFTYKNGKYLALQTQKNYQSLKM